MRIIRRFFCKNANAPTIPATRKYTLTMNFPMKSQEGSLMIARENCRHRSPGKGAIGSYGIRPWETDYDHELFLSEMVPVSFSNGCFGGLSDDMLTPDAAPYPMENAELELVHA